ncbi:MAG: phosphatase PAP2 family protein [Myxococcales bacterium]|nr:phosphatase PAP2 family protein [Myxococcales bacterium]
MFRKIAAIVVCMALLSGPSLGVAQSSNSFDDVKPDLSDLAYLSVTIPLSVFLNRTQPREGATFEPTRFDIWARNGLVWDNVGAARIASDVLLVALGGSATVAPMVTEWSLRERELMASVVGVEAISSAVLVTAVFKHLIGRQRPENLFAQGDDGYDSFFSGHSTTAFASATMLTVFAYEYEWLDDDIRWVVPVSAYATAGLTAYLRVAGDKHWITDVLLGGLIGTGVSYLVYSLRTD